MPEKNDYRQRLIEWSVAHPGQLWADTPEAAAARKWMQINAADDFRSLYWNEDEKTRSGIDRRFLPKGVEQEVYNENIREGMNQAAPYVAGALVGSAGLAAGLGALPMVPQMGSGLMKVGNAVARGIDFMGRAAMPSAVLSGSAVAPYADAAALSYWSAKGLQAANEMRKNGRWGSAAALGAVSSMPMLMPLGMRGMRMYNIAKNARVTPQEVLAEPFAESVVNRPVVQSKMVEVPSPYEIGDLGGGYMLKSLMRGNPLEKQISKQGTVSVNNIKALMNKGSKVEQAVIDKVLSSEEFAGKKAIDYNKFRKAVQDELITYEQASASGLAYEDYGMDRLGFNVIEDPAGGSIPGVPEGAIPRVLLFDSPRIPNGSAKHYFPNTLGHSRTYTTMDEPDVLHVMESQSDWAQRKAPIIGSATSVSRGVNGNTDIVLDANGIYRRVGVGEGMPESEFFHTIGDDGLTHYSRFVTQSRNDFPLEQASYLADNYTSRQIQENLRYAAEKGQTKMRYPTRETAAKIEGYTEREAYFDTQGNDITTSDKKLFTYGEKIDKRLEKIDKELKALKDEEPMRQVDLDREIAVTERTIARRDKAIRSIENGEPVEDEWFRHYTLDELKEEQAGEIYALKVYKEKKANDKGVKRFQKLTNEKLNILRDNEPRLRDGITKKIVYDHENILRRYTEFPNQYKKLFKGADIRTVTDPKGNTWYEVDVPDNYLKQEWQYAAGGDLNDKSGNPVLWDPSNIITTVPASGIRIEPSLDDLVAYSSLRRVPTKNIDYFEDKDEEFRRKRFDVDEKHLIPFIPSKSVVLTNAGKVASGAKISTNVLDSLARYGALAGVSPVDALGIPTRETSLGLYPGAFLFSPNPFLPEAHTFHGQNKLVDEGVVSPAEILNNDKFYTSPYNDAIAWAGRTVGGVGSAGDSRVRYNRSPVTDPEMDAALAKSRAYSDRLARKIDMNEHPLLHGFRLFRDRKFNTGEPGYEDHVRTDGEAVFKSPEVQKWWVSEGKNWYKGTRFEKNPLLKTVFVGEPGYELAGGGKIHIKPENRGKFTALLKRTGKSASWFKEHGTPLQKKRATFALNARKWKHGDGGYIERFGYDAVSEAVKKIKGYK